MDVPEGQGSPRSPVPRVPGMAGFTPRMVPLAKQLLQCAPALSGAVQCSSQMH